MSQSPAAWAAASRLTLPAGDYPRTTAGGAATWNNAGHLFGGRHVPCIDGKQSWKGVRTPARAMLLACLATQSMCGFCKIAAQTMSPTILLHCERSCLRCSLQRLLLLLLQCCCLHHTA